VVNASKHGLRCPTSELVAVTLDLSGNDGTTLGIKFGPPAGGNLIFFLKIFKKALREKKYIYIPTVP
jgi:hypothetical protein